MVQNDNLPYSLECNPNLIHLIQFRLRTGPGPGDVSDSSDHRISLFDSQSISKINKYKKKGVRCKKDLKDILCFRYNVQKIIVGLTFWSLSFRTIGLTAGHPW